MNHRAPLLLASFALTTTLAGCASDDAPTAERSNAYTTRNGEGFVPTTEAKAQLLEAYHPIFDRTLESCVTAPTSDKPYAVGALSGTNHSDLVTDASTLYRELNISFNLTIPKVRLTPAAGLINKSTKNNLVVNYAFYATRGYDVLNQTRPRLSPSAIALMKRSPDEFLKRCGTRYIDGLRYQADVLVMFHFEASSVEKVRQITASLTGNAPPAPADGSAAKPVITGETKALIKKTSLIEGVRASVDVAVSGFNPGTAGVTTVGTVSTETTPYESGNPSDAGSAKDSGGLSISDATFTKIDELLAAMQTSIHDDAVRDGDTPGYAKNTLRSARLAAVDMRGYQGVTDQIPYASFKKNDDAMSNVEIYLATVDKVAGKMSHALEGEILPALRAPKEELLLFNVTGKPRSTSAEVIDYAKKMEKSFKEGDSVIEATPYDSLKKLVDSCVDNGLAGDYSQCKTSTASSAVLDTASRAVSAYESERIVRLQISPLGPLGVIYAFGSCEGRSAYGPGSRLISEDEVALLRPFLKSHGTTDAFYVPQRRGCDGMPFFDADESGDKSYRCYDPSPFNPFSKKTAYVPCVPEEGALSGISEL